MGCRMSVSAWQARPAGDREQLVEVAARGHRARVRAQRRGRPLGVGAHRAAVELARDPPRVGRIAVAARGEHVAEHAGPGGHHHRAGAGGREHQPPALARLGHRELLRQPPAPGEPQHVDPVVAEAAHQRSDERGEHRVVVRQHRRGRAADARHVEPDHLEVGRELVDERLQHLQLRAEPVHEQQRRAGRSRPRGGPHGDAQPLAAHRDLGHAVLAPHGDGHRVDHVGSFAWRAARRSPSHVRLLQAAVVSM